MKRDLSLRAVATAVLLGLLLGPLPADAMSEAVRLMNHSSEAIVKQRYAEAEQLARRALERDPGLADAHYDLALALKYQGRHDEAVQHLQTALEMFPQTSENNIAKCLYGLPLIHEIKRDFQAAAEAWQKYIAFAKQHPGQRETQATAEKHLGLMQKLMSEQLRQRQAGAGAKPTSPTSPAAPPATVP